MFDDKQDNNTQDNAQAAAPADPVPDGTLGFSGNSLDAAGSNPPTDNGATTDNNVPPVNNEDNAQPVDEPTSAPEPAAPSGGPSDTPATDTAGPAADNVSEELLSVKQQALQQLSPLVGHLDQTPEEKFRTTMMMIQASDNQDLIKTAYEAAQQIQDEKERAQALLDVINEINYFTHQAGNNS